MPRGRAVTVHLGERCCLRDPLCPCRGAPDPGGTERRIREGGELLVIRGAPADAARLGETIARARRAGFARVVLATRADRVSPERARALAAIGVDALRAPLHAHVAAVHDRIAGEEGALVRALVGLRAADDAGLAIEIDAHLLALRLTTPRDVLELAHRAVPRLRAIRFALAPTVLPSALAPPPLAEIAPSLEAALARADALGVEARFEPSQGIPPCALARDPSHLARFRLDRRASRRAPGPALEETCARCAIGARCAGPARSYEDAHGARDLAPFATAPAALVRPRAVGRPAWDAAAREAARDVRFLVLRPTVHCNQDCVFCSADESSGHVWSDPGEMMRAIARAASRGVRRLSLSGGEPTLSPHLASFVEVARRAGIAEVEVVTNGVLLDREAKVDALARAGLTHAFVSLHAHDEAASAALTRKRGDHARTLRAIELLLARDVRVAINHVITTRSAPYLERFVELVRERFGARALVSLAMVSPQFKALEHPELWPRLSDVAPELRRALRRAVAVGQPVIVGSRQGVPPCFLPPFRAWSDALGVVAEAGSEDAPQKTHGRACSACRYRRVCPGLWRAYLDAHGDGELVPIEGEPYSAGELAALAAHHMPAPWALPRSFDDAPELLRDRALEGAPEPPRAARAIHLPVIASRSRPLRVVLVGSGPRAQAIARAALEVPGLAIEAIASPHAPEARLPGLDAVPRHRSLEEAIDAMRPEAAIVAAATAAHHALALAAIDAGLPLLIEKPLARTLEEAAAIARHAAARGALAAPMHQDVLAPGLRALLLAGDDAGALRWARRVSPRSPDLPRTWSRAALFETLHHPIAAVVRAARGAPLALVSAHASGGGGPERVRVVLRAGALDAEIAIERAASDDLRVTRAHGASYLRAGARAELRAVDGTSIDARGSALASLLEAFRRAVTGEPPLDEHATLPPPSDAVAALRATLAAIEALDASGAPFDRPTAPRHAASPELRELTDAIRRRG